MTQSYLKLLLCTLLTLSCSSWGRGIQLEGSICKPVVIQVSEGLTMNQNDYIVINKAKDGCIRYYGQQSCLKVFRKTKERQYEVICSSHHSTTK